MIFPILYGTISSRVHTGGSLDGPAGLSVEVAGSTFEVTYDAVIGALSYEWRKDNSGSWTNVGTATSFSSTAATGAHTVQVRAIGSDGSGATSSTGFAIDAEVDPVTADSTTITADDTTHTVDEQ